MISRAEATAIALKVYPGFDSCKETEFAYVFGDSRHDNDEGGLGTPLVVMKKDGTAYNYIYALMNGLLGKSY